MQEKVFKKEKNKLAETIERVIDAKNYLSESLQSLGQDNLEKLQDLRENPETSGMDFFIFLEQIHQENTTFNVKDKYKRLEELNFLENEPYFARIDLQDQGKKEEQKIYIGKFGYTEDQPVVTDWRAKIASVYYRYRYPQKNVKYETPGGLEVRDLLLKRTFEIEDGELLKYYNNDLQLDETEIIAEKIEKRTGGVLEDIVETIQESQLDIIEADPRQVCIVQGCVGSGKSTVAIHKLSHIFFNYPDLIKPERAILLAKNQILVSYLSTLFPKLGIFDINYKTLRELVFNVVFREKLNVKLDLDKNQNTSSAQLSDMKKIDQEIAKINTLFAKETEKLFAHEDYEPFGGYRFSKQLSPFENLNELISELEEELGRQKDAYDDNPRALRAMFYKDNMKTLREILKKIKRLRLKLKNKTFQKLIKKLDINTKEKLGYFESLIYLYIYSELIGFENFRKYEYCVIDEGQDLSVLEYSLIQKLVLKGRFCILGDLNQGYREEGLNSWDEISQVIKEAKKAQLFTLDTNYRSTKPIIDLARSTLEPYTKDFLPNSINRKGDEPIIASFNSQKEMIETLEKNLQKDVEQSDKSIGIIAFNQDDLIEATKLVKSKKIPEERTIVLEKDKNIDYSARGIYLMDFENCKGLEFSKVYVLGLNPHDSDSFNQAKKAFIAISRAMNDLNVYYIR